MTSADSTHALVKNFCKVGELKTESVSISTQTGQRINEFISKYGSKAAESAIISATYSMMNSKPGSSIWFWNEFHGRQFKNYENTHAPGWFTSMYPIKIRPNGKRISTLNVLDTLNHIPDNGFSFGYQASNLNNSPDNLRPQIRFNFLGEFPSTFDHFDVNIIENQFTMHANNKHDVAIDVNTVFTQGEWTINFDYHPELDAFKFESFESLLVESLDELESHNISEKSLTEFFSTENVMSAEQRIDVVVRHEALAPNIEISDSYPLSPLQQGLLYHAQLKSTIQSGLQQLVLQFDKHLDFERLKNSIQTIVQRHAPLRTVFSNKLSEPIQVVTSMFPEVKQTTLSDLEFDAYSKALDETLVRDLKTPFDLFNAPPVRFEYICGPAGKSALVFTIHHIIYDGWSNDIYLKELSTSYSGHELPKIDGKWAQFVQICRKMAQKDTLNYWIPLLSKNVTTNPLDWAKSLNTGNANQIAPGEINFDSIQESDLREHAQKMNSSLSTYIQAAWGLALLTSGSHQRVTFGSVYSGRYGHSVNVDDHIGLFISTVPFTIQFEAQQSPSELLECVHSDMILHQDHPFANLPEIATELGVHELFDSILVIENYPLNTEEYVFRDVDGEGVSIKAYRFHSEESVPLTVSVNYNPDFHIEIRYDATRFQSVAIKKLADTFEFMLKNIPDTSFATTGDLVAAWKKNQADKLKTKSLGKLTALKNK